MPQVHPLPGTQDRAVTKAKPHLWCWTLGVNDGWWLKYCPTLQLSFLKRHKNVQANVTKPW